MADRALLRHVVSHLASFDRPSASAGERRAADWIAGELRRRGCDARVERERAHGGYWWPLGLLTAAGAVAGVVSLRGRRALGAAVAAATAAGIWDDVGGGRLWFRRAALPARDTFNVVAGAGDPGAARTLVLIAHHDAAHSGAIFSPAVPALVARRFPGLLARSKTSPPLMMLVFAGPALVALGSALRRRWTTLTGTALAAGSAATFADIGARNVVPGANDNLTGVATLVAVADALARDPVRGVRVLLLSTGSEESAMEGMQAFARRHFPELSPARTTVLCIDTVGSPALILPEAEGMLRMRPYTPAVKELVADCARAAGVPLERGLRFSFATDALIAMRDGYPTALLGSLNEYKAPSNYHWPTDTPDRVDYDRVADAATLCEAVVRRLADGPGVEGPAPAPVPVSEAVV